MESKEFLEYAQININTAESIFGVQLGYTEASILMLDELIDAAWPDEPPVLIDNMILLWGSFLGEAIIRTLGGEWLETSEGWCVQIGDLRIMVFNKIKKRFLNGNEDSISYYYQSLKQGLASNFSYLSK